MVGREGCSRMKGDIYIYVCVYVCVCVCIHDWFVLLYGRCCESAARNMPANLDNSAVATGLEKVSFHSNPKERQCQRMLKVKVKVKSLSRVRLFANPWTVAYQAHPSMGFSRQEYWSGLPFPSPGDLPDPGIEPGSPTFQADALTTEPPGKPLLQHNCTHLTR